MIQRTQASLSEKIGNGVDFISPEVIAKCIRTECPIGIFQINGQWMMNTEVPSSTEGTIAVCDIVIDFEHMDMSAFDADWTVTDHILEEIRFEGERQTEAAEIKADEEYRAVEEATN